jgi:hypothetical protein
MADHQEEKESTAVAEVTASVQELMLKDDSEYVRVFPVHCDILKSQVIFNI